MKKMFLVDFNFFSSSKIKVISEMGRCNFKGKNSCENALSLKPNGIDYYKLCDLHRAMKNQENELIRKQKHESALVEVDNRSPTVEEKNLVVQENFYVIPANPVYGVMTYNPENETDFTPRPKELVQIRKSLINTTINTVEKKIKKEATEIYQQIYNQLECDSMKHDKESLEKCSIIDDIFKFEFHENLMIAFKNAFREKNLETWKSFFSEWSKKLSNLEIPYYYCPDKPKMVLAPLSPDMVPLEKNLYLYGYIMSIIILRKDKKLNLQTVSFTNDRFQWVKWRGEYHMYRFFTMSIFITDSSFKQDMYLPVPVYLWLNYVRDFPLPVINELYETEFKNYVSCYKEIFCELSYPTVSQGENPQGSYLESSYLISRFNELYYDLTMNIQWQANWIKDSEKNTIIAKLELFKNRPEIHKFFPEHFAVNFLEFLERLQKQSDAVPSPSSCDLARVATVELVPGIVLTNCKIEEV